MTQHFFVSYSSADGKDFSLRLAKELSAPPVVPLWVDDLHLRPGEDWDEQLVEAIRTCFGLIFVMTEDSVQPESVCKNEWVRALKYKKPVIPLLAQQNAELPFRLGSREYIDFTGPYADALTRLRQHCSWMNSPPGQLQTLKYRLADGKRELRRALPERQALIQEEIAELERQIAQQQAIIDNPVAAEERVQQSIDLGLERAREPAKPVGGIAKSKFINPPPLVAPTWFQDRHVETGLIGDFLKDDALRLMTVVGRGGVGKSAMVCRLLRSLERGELPDDLGPLTVDGIVYLSDARQFHRVTVPDLYAGLIRLLPDETVQRLDSVYKNPQATSRETMQALTEAFPAGRTIVLLDNFEDEVNIETGEIKNSELDEALRALLELPPHGLKVIITTRVAPTELAQVQPVCQRRLNLDAGLEHPFAENILRAMDADGKVGLKDAPEALLTQARERTHGFPRALEHLFGILSADRDTSLQDLLIDTEQLLPDKVVEVLVGEAFNRLDINAQRVMQALATYRYPVPPAAVDYLLQPYIAGIDSGPVLSRLVNMQFVRREAGRYYLHQIDHDYALDRTPEGEPADRQAEVPPLTCFALRHRAAEWFKLSRRPRETWKTLDDLAAQLSEFDLRCSGEDYNTAAAVLLEIDFDYLILWGHYRLVTGLHEQLQGKITDPNVQQASVANLGTSYFRMGKTQQALLCYEQGLQLTRESDDRWNEGAFMTRLGNWYIDIGETAKGIDFYERALVIAREVDDQTGEATNLGNLANGYSLLGQTARAIDNYEHALALHRKLRVRPSEALFLFNIGGEFENLNENTKAIECYKDAVTIAREIGYRTIESAGLAGMGWVSLAREEWEEAMQHFTRCTEIADDIGDSQFQKWGRMGLALTSLYQGDLEEARKMAVSAQEFDRPSDNPYNLDLLGTIALRQGDRVAAKQVFATAIRLNDQLLVKSPEVYDTLDLKGLALCGLVLCGDRQHLQAAIEAFRAARAINSNKGVIHRLTQLLDALAKADIDGVLAEARVAAAGA